MVILGIDPGIEKVGYGILDIESKNRKVMRKIGWGCIQTKKTEEHQNRILVIHKKILDLIQKIKPELIGVEKLFFFKNAKTAFKVSEARGVILLAAALKNIPLLEFTPLQVKQTLANYGRADKKQIQLMVKMNLKLKEIPQPDDAADALAIALCAMLHMPRQ